MIQLIIHTPTYVWAIFFYLMITGYQATKVRCLSWRKLATLPLILLTWALYSHITEMHSNSLFIWLSSMTAGIWIGMKTVGKQKLLFDKQQNLVKLSGSLIPLVLSIVIFALRYFLAVYPSLYPQSQETFFIRTIQVTATIFSGMFLGRLLEYWRRQRISPHTTLKKKNY